MKRFEDRPMSDARFALLHLVALAVFCLACCAALAAIRAYGLVWIGGGR